MSGDDAMWTPGNPSRPGDEADDQPRVIANRLHAVQVEMHNGFDRMGRALEGLGRIDAKLDVIIDRQNIAEARMDAQDLKLAALDLRIAALETTKRRTLARKKR